MTKSEKCPLCGSLLVSHTASSDMSGEFYNCPQCGKFTVTDETQNRSDFKEKKHLLAGYFFEIDNRFMKSDFPVLTEDSYTTILKSSIVPQRISDKPMKLLEFLNSATKEYGEIIEFPLAALYARSLDEAIELVKSLDKEGYVEDLISMSVLRSVILLKGIQYIEEVEQKNNISPEQAFVAMWFKDSEQIVKDVWEKIIKPGCEDAGYKAVRVLEREYNDSVVDEIIALIKESAFAVVDFSGYRGGVYYEAGYAKGLGKDVINLCHENWFDHPEVDNHKIHFDVSHNNFIVWESGREEEAKVKLTNRIRAIVGMGSYPSSIEKEN